MSAPGFASSPRAERQPIQQQAPAGLRRKSISAMGRVGIVIVSAVILLALFYPWITPYGTDQVADRVSQPPPALAQWPALAWRTVVQGESAPHWFGTDAAGLDVFTRTLAAARTDLVIALSANVISFLAGVSLGVLVGYGRNFATESIARAADLLQSFPVFITAMILVALAGRTWTNIVLALSILYAPIYLRLTRTQVELVALQGYVEAARALGKAPLRVALEHVMPNSIRPALVQFSVTIGFAILLTAGLSFVGAGVRPPTPEWGLMIANGATQLVLGDWWPALFPGIAISITVFGFALCGYELERQYGGQ